MRRPHARPPYRGGQHLPSNLQAAGLGAHEHARARIAGGLMDREVGEPGVGEHAPGELLAESST